MIYPLAPNGIYWTIQGEGTHTGTPMAFVRLAGCSVGCAQCDTNYTASETLDAAAIWARVREVTPPRFRAAMPWVWITGGEPTDHDLAPLCDVLATGYRIGICTSGHNQHWTPRPAGRWRIAPWVEHPGVRWISVSPHRVISGLRGDEVKLVPGLGDLHWSDLDDTGWIGGFRYRWLQPLAGSPSELSRAVDFVHLHPGWRLSTQAHLHWGIP